MVSRFTSRPAAHRAAWVLAAVFLVATPAGAQETRRSGDSSARLQAAVQQLTTEKASLQAENTALKEKLARLEKEAGAAKAAQDDLQRRAGAAEARVGRAEAGQQATASRLELTESRLNEVVAKYRELVESLRRVEAERDGLAAQATRDGEALRNCARSNLELAAVGNEALDRYEQKGCWAALAQKEPFTRIGRARIENAVEDSRARIEALKLPPAAPAAPVPGPSGP